MLAEERNSVEQKRSESAYDAVPGKSKGRNLMPSKSGIPAKPIKLPGSVSVSTIMLLHMLA